MNETPSTSPTTEPARSGQRATLFIILLACLFVLMPYLFWRATWFGRPLDDKEMQEYLADAKHPRRAQHALSQIADRILAGDARVKRWYPEVELLAAHPLPELRMTAAWVMGQDNRVPGFHEALLRLLHDPDPVVRQNAALALVRFGDASGRAEMRAMLEPYTLTATHSGLLSYRLREDNTLSRGTLVARIQTMNGTREEVRSPLPGTFAQKLVAEGTRVSSGEPIARLAPSSDQVWGALQGLYLFGEADDLPAVERYARGVPGMPERVQQQAALTAKAIRARSAGTRPSGVTGAGPGG